MAPYRRAFRFETRELHGVTGAGPWSGVRYAWRHMRREQSPGCMPGPGSDNCLRDCGSKPTGVSYYNPRHRAPLRYPNWRNSRFAYPSLDILRRWCGKEALESAAAEDFVIRVYAVPWESHVLYENQIIFDADKSRVIREMSTLDVPVELEVRAIRQMAT